MTRHFATPSAFADAVGEELGTTRWVRLDRSRVDTFLTAIHAGERQQSEAATTVPGWLILASTSPLLKELYEIGQVKLRINYGADSIRLEQPVAVGSRVRAQARIAAAHTSGPGIRVTVAMSLESDNGAVGTADVVMVVVPSD